MLVWIDVDRLGRVMEAGALIRDGRASRGWSQRELARVLRVSPSAVAQWELGGTLPTIAHRLRLARELGIPFEKLLPEAEAAVLAGVEDPLQRALLMQAQKLPRRLVEALVVQVAGMVEALARASRPGQRGQLNKD